MIDFDTALQTALGVVRRTGAERVPLAEARGRVLACDVRSDVDMPPFDKSAMDGYACRRADLGGELKVLETIAAGTVPEHDIGPGECAGIMTGAVVPAGADCVIMVEFTEKIGTGEIRFTGSGTRDNICLKGEDVRMGDVVLEQGAWIGPAEIATMSAVGCVNPEVAVKPTVGILATGSELVPPDEIPGPGRIRNSNSSQLAAQVQLAGADPVCRGIVEDTRQALDVAVREAVAASDVVLLSGGVSMGRFDYVPEVLKQNGIELLFDRVAVKPGKPATLGVSEDVFCVGLPGNPVSTFVLFEILVKPFLLEMLGHHYRPTILTAPLGRDFSRKKTSRDSWIPVRIDEEGRAMPVDYHGSAHAHALCSADGLVCVKSGISRIEEGSPVRVRQI